MSRSLISMFLIGDRTPDEDQAKALSQALFGEVPPAAWMEYKVPSDAMRPRRNKPRRGRRAEAFRAPRVEKPDDDGTIH